MYAHITYQLYKLNDFSSQCSPPTLSTCIIPLFLPYKSQSLLVNMMLQSGYLIKVASVPIYFEWHLTPYLRRRTQQHTHSSVEAFWFVLIFSCEECNQVGRFSNRCAADRKCKRTRFARDRRRTSRKLATGTGPRLGWFKINSYSSIPSTDWNWTSYELHICNVCKNRLPLAHAILTASIL